VPEKKCGTRHVGILAQRVNGLKKNDIEFRKIKNKEKIHPDSPVGLSGLNCCNKVP
jgi:hypothetical protein